MWPTIIFPIIQEPGEKDVCSDSVLQNASKNTVVQEASKDIVVQEASKDIVVQEASRIFIFFIRNLKYYVTNHYFDESEKCVWPCVCDHACD